MKNVFTILAAVLMVLWYSLSVIGFDVHTCSGSGETFIATVASGFACEDIHPEHVRPESGHSECGCCHSHDSEPVEASGHGFDSKPCCTDDYQVIILTGTRGSDQQRYNDANHSEYCTYVAEVPVIDYYSNKYSSDIRVYYKLCIGGIVPQDLQASYNIWRI